MVIKQKGGDNFNIPKKLEEYFYHVMEILSLYYNYINYISNPDFSNSIFISIKKYINVIYKSNSNNYLLKELFTSLELSLELNNPKLTLEYILSNILFDYTTKQPINDSNFLIIILDF